MKAILKHRTSCRLCESKNVELVVKLEPIPLSENYCEDADSGKRANRYPVDLYMCSDCGHVQQLDVVDSKSLWDSYTYYSGDAKGMPEHFYQVAEKLMKIYKPEPGSLVIDIGSNDGSLLKPFKERGHRVLGIDPATEVARQATAAGIETIPELMTLPLARNILKVHGSAKIICMFNAFAHADNMNEIIESIRMMLSPDGIFVFEAQYLVDIIDKVLIATIFHEHMSHHSVKPLVSLFEKYNMELIDIERVPIQHGSIIGIAKFRGGKHKVCDSVQAILDLEASYNLNKIETLRQFASKIKILKDESKQLVKFWQKTKARVAGYGAARSGPTLISQLGLGGVIECIYDNHPQKINKFSSGDGIPILATDKINCNFPDFLVILAWVHSFKIIESNKDYLDRGGKFIVLCPEMRIISKYGESKIAEYIAKFQKTTRD